MGKIKSIFNFNNIGGKIKNFAKWLCWITILLIWIAAPIAFFVLISDEWTAEYWWIPFISAVVGPIFVWISSFTMYAFGELVEDTHAMRNNECPQNTYEEDEEDGEDDDNDNLFIDIVCPNCKESLSFSESEINDAICPWCNTEIKIK